MENIISLINMSMILAIVGVLVVLTNIITQVIKKMTWDKLPTNVLVVLISMALTLAVFFAYGQITALVMTWYMVTAAIVVGFLTAYAAMFGFDKLKEALAQIDQNKAE